MGSDHFWMNISHTIIFKLFFLAKYAYFTPEGGWVPPTYLLISAWFFSLNSSLTFLTLGIPWSRRTYSIYRVFQSLSFLKRSRVNKVLQRLWHNTFFYLGDENIKSLKIISKVVGVYLRESHVMSDVIRYINALTIRSDNKNKAI